MPYDPSPYLEPAKCGLILFECQEAVIGEGTRLSGLRSDVVSRKMIENLGALLETARQTGVTVAYCNMAFRRDGLAAPKTPRTDRGPAAPPSGPAPPSPVVAPLRPLAHELVIDRIHGMSSFYGTPLEPALRGQRVETVIPAGVSLNIGIIATTVEALNRGFRVVIARDCVAGDPSRYADDVMRNTLNNLAYLSTGAQIARVWREQVGRRTGASAD